MTWNWLQSSRDRYVMGTCSFSYLRLLWSWMRYLLIVNFITKIKNLKKIATPTSCKPVRVMWEYVQCYNQDCLNEYYVTETFFNNNCLSKVWNLKRHTSMTYVSAFVRASAAESRNVVITCITLKSSRGRDLEWFLSLWEEIKMFFNQNRQPLSNSEDPLHWAVF